MKIQSLGQNQSLQPNPDTSRNTARLLSEFKRVTSEIDRLGGEIESENKRIARDRESLKSKLSEFGVSNSAGLKGKLEEYRTGISSDFYSLQSSVIDLESRILRMEGEKSIHERQIQESEKTIGILESDIKRYDETLSFLRDVSESARTAIVARIETFVSEALSKIFGDGVLKFKIEMKVKGGVPFAEFQLEDCLTGQQFEVLDSFGGGVADVVSTTLRLAILELMDPANTGPVVLDEVGKFLSDEKQEKFGEFLSQWSREFKRQIILITHKPLVLKHVDRIFRIRKEDTSSIVEILDPSLEESNAKS